MQSSLSNEICPYCWTLLVRAENQPNSRSVEHLIPNTALTKPRTKRDGDFFACRSCNSRKGHIDYVLGIVAKTQSSDDELAVHALISAVSGDDGRSKRFIQMAAEAVETPSGVLGNIPIFGDELLEYISFLGRGQYFRKHGRPFDQNRQVMIVHFVNKPVMSNLERDYGVVHGSSPFEDIQKNKYAESYGDGECIIYSKNDRYLFLFHSYTAIIIQIKRRNRKHEEESRISAADILRYFELKQDAV